MNINKSTRMTRRLSYNYNLDKCKLSSSVCAAQNQSQSRRKEVPAPAILRVHRLRTHKFYAFTFICHAHKLYLRRKNMMECD